MTRLYGPAARVLAGALVALGVSVASAAASAPVQVVEELHAVLERNMDQGATLGFRGRLEAVSPVVSRVFDFDTISRVAVGDAWTTLDAAGQARFRGLMERLSAVTYADRFDARGSNERFVTVTEQPARGGRVVVRTHLERDGAPPVALDYVLGETGGHWRIINVLADGVSDLSLKRAEYAAVMRSGGVDTLLERVEEQVRDLTRRAEAGG